MTKKSYCSNFSKAIHFYFYSRIWDYYTRDRSTPKRDTVWGGSNDLTAAAGWERDGETVIMFRKKLKGNGFTDHDIVDENMHVIWAVG